MRVPENVYWSTKVHEFIITWPQVCTGHSIYIIMPRVILFRILPASWILSCRVSLAMLGFMGGFLSGAIKDSLNITIVCMVNYTALDLQQSQHLVTTVAPVQRDTQGCYDTDVVQSKLQVSNCYLSYTVKAVTTNKQ